MDNKGVILAVDDTQPSLALLAKILHTEGYRVRLANSGQLALDSVSAEPPELILLDLRMPGVDGFEVLRRLKESEKSRRIPVIFLSAATELETVVEGLKLGAVDYVTKPFRPAELLARVTTQLMLSRLQILTETQKTELGAKNASLEEAQRKIKVLAGLLPICSRCKKIRNDEGFWIQLERYISDHSEAEFSHGMCAGCMAAYYPDYCKPD